MKAADYYRAFLLAAAMLGCLCVQGAEKRFAWQEDYARVTETGDIEWAPKEFRFVATGEARFIDYENGSDDADGASRERPWKHHPWDAAATGKSSAARGIETYVFKGGVVYRGQLAIKEQGRPGAPIRLTRNPAWGDGAAILAGSQIVTGWQRGGVHPKIPQPESVWQASLDFAPRTLWRIDSRGRAVRIPLARHPNWKSQPEDHKAQWFTWTNERHPFRPKSGFSANDAAHLKGVDEDFVRGALIYSEFGWVMGTPYPTRVNKFDPADGSVQFAGWTGGGNASIVFRGMRYYLEDKPQYLDDPEGEFWFDRRGAGGTLYLRLPGGTDPNRVRIEAGRHPDLILGTDVKHLEISGLDFRWTTQPWELDVSSWDFRTKPFGVRPEANPACIRIWGKGESIRIAHCRFEDVVMGIRMRAVGEGSPIREITLEDNVFRNADVGAAHLTAGAGWGFSHPVGVLDDVRLYRNAAANIGFRAPRYERGTTFDLTHPFRAHIAGNVVHRCGAQAINVVGGKGPTRGDVPLVRVLIHQNKAWKTMQNGNDFGGIESWQHGPVYIFNNLSFDARGQREGERVHAKGNAGFGHAYYLDGGFKHYLFNNIAWGLSNDPQSPLVNCAAFQEIYSHQNLFLNNTAYNFTVGSRRQAPHAGRNKYLGNVWQGISERVFRHADPARTEADGNAAHAGRQKDRFAYETNAYASNVFYDVAQLGVLETSGRWLPSLDDFRAALKQQSLVSDLGVLDPVATLRDPSRGDFRLNRQSAAVDRGVVAFVPWALHGVAAEWNFYHAGDNPSQIIDEHWYAKDFITDRTEYHARPTYPLTAVNVTPEDYVRGPLEDFVASALRFTPSKKTYATVPHAVLEKPVTALLATRASHGQDPQKREFTFTGEQLRTPAIYAGNFLVEVYFRADGDGLLVGKMEQAGYQVAIRGGRALFRIAGPHDPAAELTSQTRLADGKWHHLIAECDRDRKTLAIYVDGKLDSQRPGLGKVSLANNADLYVGGSPQGDYLGGAIDFLRIAHGTLADARTTIEELYAWQFDGPAGRDMRGASPKGKARDAGALETF